LSAWIAEQTLLPYACDQGIKGLLQIIFSYFGLPSSKPEMLLSQRKTNGFVSGPFQLCSMAIKCWTAAVFQLRNVWCLEKLCILDACKENKAWECFGIAAVWKCKLLFSHSLLRMIWRSRTTSECLPVSVYANVHTHIYSREHMVLTWKETYIHFFNKLSGWQVTYRMHCS